MDSDDNVSSAPAESPSPSTVAWREWLAEHGPRLVLFARQQSRSSEDAEDIVQDALVKLVEKLDAGDYALEQEAHVRDGGRPPQAGVAPVGEPPGGMDGLPAPLRKAFLVIGLALAIGTFYVVTQLPELWWLLLWMPLFVVRRLMRRTLAK